MEGTRHLRVNCFGDKVIAFEIESEALDWRPALADCYVRRVALHDELQGQLVTLQNELGLSMSIHDLKVRPNGEVVWFELNPQGQFLFLQGLTGDDLAGEFTQYLVRVGMGGGYESGT